MTQEDTPTVDSETDSITNVNIGIWGGTRKVIGIRCDENLYNAFKPVAKARFGSVCCAMEGFMAGILGALENSEVNFSNTVNINDLHVHRNLRARRRLDPDSPLLEDTPDEKARAIEENNRQLEEMQTEAKKIQEVEDLVREVVEALTPWSERSSDIYDALYERGVVYGEASELHSRILNILQSRLHSGVRE